MLYVFRKILRKYVTRTFHLLTKISWQTSQDVSIYIKRTILTHDSKLIQSFFVKSYKCLHHLIPLMEKECYSTLLILNQNPLYHLEQKFLFLSLIRNLENQYHFLFISIDQFHTWVDKLFSFHGCPHFQYLWNFMRNKSYRTLYYWHLIYK